MKKSAFEKFQTKLQRLKSENDEIIERNWMIIFRNKLFFSYNTTKIKYWKYRFYSTQVESIKNDGIKCEIVFSDNTIKLLNSNLLNPPQKVEKFVKSIKSNFPHKISTIIIWWKNSWYNRRNHRLQIKENLFNTLCKILQEENTEKTNRIISRFNPFFSKNYWIELGDLWFERDYKVLLEELMSCWKITSQDVKQLVDRLSPWCDIEYALKKTISKQSKRLIDSIQTIVDTWKLNREKARNLWYNIFGYPKNSITWPEHLMEKILTQFGKNVIFWVPVLLSMKKYILDNSEIWTPKSQFDIVLINHLTEIQIVELKRPDTYVLSYDENRWKFYPSKDLSIAISQSERYISLVYKDKDEDYKIDWMLLREYINSQIEWMHMPIEVCRPTALIVIGSSNTIAEPYEELSENIRWSVTKQEYERNRDLAYREIVSAFKNLSITTYSDLLDIARTRLAISE